MSGRRVLSLAKTFRSAYRISCSKYDVKSQQTLCRVGAKNAIPKLEIVTLSVGAGMKAKVPIRVLGLWAIRR